jgi:3-deoxy-manno-octulosonate cytidylyltransferase (CMP-KDO synthetase)
VKIIGIIPARLGSTRVKAKMLTDINGKPVIQHTYEHTQEAKILADVFVATDSIEIADAVRKFGGKVIMTSADNRTGTDRVSEAVCNIPCNIVVNIQGDEAFIHPEIIELAVNALQSDPDAVAGTVARRINNEDEYLDRNVVKVVMDINKRALYFSRAAIPHSKTGKMSDSTEYYHHVGIYSFRRDFILKYPKLKKSILEETESLEQLRMLENGYIIKVGITDKETIKIDTFDDIKKARKKKGA